MLRKLIKNKKAQNTAEYAILISLVVAGVIAMQTYAQRALQGKVRDASGYLTSSGAAVLTEETKQYEPYYLETSYNIKRYESKEQYMDDTITGTEARVDSTRTREADGYQASSYNTVIAGGETW